MCVPASMWVLKDKVLWSKYTESHTQIAFEHNLHIDGVRGQNGVKIEITPPAYSSRIPNFLAPLDEWKFNIDSEYISIWELPDWFDKDDAEARVREVLPDWVKCKVIYPRERRDFCAHAIVACYGTIGTLTGNISVLGGDACIERFNAGEITIMCGNSKILSTTPGSAKKIQSMLENAVVYSNYLITVRSLNDNARFIISCNTEEYHNLYAKFTSGPWKSWLVDDANIIIHNIDDMSGCKDIIINHSGARFG